MTDQPKPDPKAVISSFNQLIRNQRNLRRVQVTPSMSRTALNDALRIAGGHDPQHEEAGPEPGSYPWKSLASREDDADAEGNPPVIP